MTQQAYEIALADLRKWHEGDRFQKHFNDIEAHVNALSTLTEVKSLPAPTSILLTRDSEGRLLDPTTGEPFNIVINTVDGNREVTHITFAGERDVPFDALPTIETPAEEHVLKAVPAEPLAPEKAESVFAAIRDALDLSKVPSELTTIDGLPVVPSDEPLLTTVHPDVSPVTLGTFDDLGKDELPDESDTEDGDDEADEPADDAAPTDIATSDEAVPAVKPPRKPAKKKRG